MLGGDHSGWDEGHVGMRHIAVLGEDQWLNEG